MPVIPSYTSIQRVIPKGQAPVARVGNAGAVGDAISEFGQQAGRFIEAKAKYDASNAETEFLIKKADLDTELTNPNNARALVGDKGDYSVIEKNYTDRLGALRDDIGAKLRFPGAADRFTGITDLHIAQGTQRAKGVALALEHTTERDSTKNALIALAEAASVDGADPTSFQDNAKERVNSGVSLGYFTQPEADATLKEWANAVAKTRIEGITDFDMKVKALESPWIVANLPEVTRRRLMDQGAEQNMEKDADQAVFQLLDLDQPFELKQQAFEQFSKEETDPKRRLLFQRSWDRETGRREQEKNRIQGALVDEYYEPVSNGMLVSSIPSDKRDAMGERLATLLAAQSNYAARGGAGSFYAKQTSPAAHDAMIRVTNDPNARPGDVKKVYDAYRTQLTEADYKKYGEIAATGVVPPQAKSEMTTHQQLAIKGNKLSKEKLGKASLALDDWHIWYQQQNAGKLPSPDERSEAIDRALLDLDLTPGTDWNPLNWGGSKSGYEVPGTISGPNRKWNEISEFESDLAKNLRARYPNMTESELTAEFQKRWAKAKGKP